MTETCCECSGTGWESNYVPCDWCDGTGSVDIDDIQPREEEMKRKKEEIVPLARPMEAEVLYRDATPGHYSGFTEHEVYERCLIFTEPNGSACYVSMEGVVSVRITHTS